MRRRASGWESQAESISRALVARPIAIRSAAPQTGREGRQAIAKREMQAWNLTDCYGIFT
jgi:hypothetical protein